ncbi:uridine kinase [Streptomyces uncialis]|uniref:uridine kinase family protein n=1 Tax=Streptomyces uncialis TaxID=1048205 RepID=UPI0037F55D27
MTGTTPPAPHAPAAPPPGLAGELALLPPSCGPVRLIAVDGHAGSGKTTFAAALAAALDGAPVLHLDDIATHDELFGWTDRLLSQVVAPLRDGRPARYTPYDWTARAFGPPRLLRAAPVVLVEGVGAGRLALRPYLARVLWMEFEPDAAWQRGRLRDGPAQRAFWRGWVAAERRHFAQDPSRPYATRLIQQGRTGYVMSPGPAAPRGTPGIVPSVTEGEVRQGG